MFVDSRTLANFGTCIREPAKMENKIDPAYLRECFIPQGIVGCGWISGHYNISDRMRNDNGTSAALLLRSIREGIHPFRPDTVTH